VAVALNNTPIAALITPYGPLHLHRRKIRGLQLERLSVQYLLRAAGISVTLRGRKKVFEKTEAELDWSDPIVMSAIVAAGLK